MLTILRTDSSNKDFQNLVALLDADLKKRDGDEHSFYAQFNKIAPLKNAVVAYENGVPVGCGAVKKFSADTMEVKRMYVPPALRGKGILTNVFQGV